MMILLGHICCLVNLLLLSILAVNAPTVPLLARGAVRPVIGPIVTGDALDLHLHLEVSMTIRPVIVEIRLVLTGINPAPTKEVLQLLMSINILLVLPLLQAEFQEELLVELQGTRLGQG